MRPEAINSPAVSVIIPTFNGATRIVACLNALIEQVAAQQGEIVVVNDGSSDSTAEVVGRYPGLRLITQANAGPAAARNRGALEARGEILLFTDDDCVPMPIVCRWRYAIRRPAVVGAKGTYRTRQKELIARFVQIEYQDRYRLMKTLDSIDFVDTYSAAFRRDRFLEMSGYDTSFPVACAEDVELSYRMSARGWKMKFAPNAIVYHTHPDTLWAYLRKKYKFAYWRVLAVRKNPSKAVKDSHTPQLMKLQILFLPALVAAATIDLTLRPKITLTGLCLAAFLASTLLFSARAAAQDRVVGLFSPILLAMRSCAQVMGVIAGMVNTRRNVVAAPSKFPA